jgi:hypothetical protein
VAVSGELTPTRVRDLAGYSAGVAVVAWLAVREWYGDLPVLNWAVPLSVLLLAGAEAYAASDLRARIRRRSGAGVLRPLVAARMLALARASALGGSVLLGVWAGLLAYALPKRDSLAAAGGDAATAGVGIATSVALIGAALWLEYCCRAPTPPDRDTRTSPDGS